MFSKINITAELLKTRVKKRSQEDILLDEIKHILNSDLLKENKILSHLKFYNKSFELLNENEIDNSYVFSLDEIKKICIKYRLRFLDSQLYRNEIPYEAVLKIKDLNTLYHKDLKGFKILAPAKAYSKKENDLPCLLFVPTLSGNYYLIHSWGKEFKWYMKYLLFPPQTFETLLLSVAIFTLIIDLSLPVELITLDRSAPYWCGYRIATFFHLMIFF
ncbi:MAG TPA: hypothetical protein VN026_02115, partial [Bacteroidia bacterium]|nr:hypothetical protein [Bacteroidia bacterium]